jgi:hypothetical protein
MMGVLSCKILVLRIRSKLRSVCGITEDSAELKKLYLYGRSGAITA